MAANTWIHFKNRYGLMVSLATSDSYCEKRYNPLNLEPARFAPLGLPDQQHAEGWLSEFGPGRAPGPAWPNDPPTGSACPPAQPKSGQSLRSGIRQWRLQLQTNPASRAPPGALRAKPRPAPGFRPGS